MALSKDIIEETEFAKSQVLNSDLEQGWKKSILRLLHTATEATNGISLDEKIQKITEAIHGLVLSQINFISAIDKKMETAIENRCNTCKAFKHANDIEYEKQKAEIIQSWKEANGIKDDKKQENSAEDQTWTNVLKTILVKPAAWIFLSILVLSPYGVDIVKTILEFCGK